MNKVFKKVVAFGLAATTILSMTFTASAITVTDKNDDGNFAYSSQFNDCRTGAAGGYVWDTAAKQALYPEFTKSYLSTKRTFVSSKTYSDGQMIGMLDKSINSLPDAANYAKNLTIKDKKGRNVCFRVEREPNTGRIGLRAMSLSAMRSDTHIAVSAVTNRGNNVYHTVGIFIEGMYPNANISIPGYSFVGGNHGEKGWCTKPEDFYVIDYRDNTKIYFGDLREISSDLNLTGGKLIVLEKNLGTLSSYNGKNISGNSGPITIHANGEQKAFSNLVAYYSTGSRCIEVTPIKPNVNCFDYSFGFINNPADQDAVFDVCGKVESNYRLFLKEKKGTLFTEDEILKMYTEATIKDFKAACPTGSIRVVSGHDAELKDGEWLVAMRFGRDVRKVTERYYNRVNGVMTAKYQTYDLYWSDFHYMYRACNGKWYNKHGQLASEECSGNIINPSTDPTDGWISNPSTADMQISTAYYDSETVYFAVKK
ncbi:MAG: hypothetical protein IJF09_06190 [Ruminiclostridium sp.]|nr:hypothetical protein [Ruminiclostridium sp.]